MPRTLKSLKTPLRYPGGKSKAVPKLLQYLPNLFQVKEFREPFLGGGSVALEITKRYPHIDVWVNDLYEPLYNFWCELQHNGQELQDALLGIKSIYCNPDAARCLFITSKEQINDSDLSNFDRAVAFYIVNKCSFSGLTESSSFSAQASESNFSTNGIERLTEYSELIERWKITNLSYESMLCDDKDTFIYLDPPYAPEKSDSFVNYVADGFDLKKHRKLFNEVKKLDFKNVSFLMSNANVEMVQTSMKKFKIDEIMARRAIHSKNPGAKAKEVLIYNK